MFNLGIIGDKDFIYPFSLSGFFTFEENNEKIFEEIKEKNISFLIVTRDVYNKKREYLEEFEKEPEKVLFILPTQNESWDEKMNELKRIAIEAIGVDLWKEKKE